MFVCVFVLLLLIGKLLGLVAKGPPQLSNTCLYPACLFHVFISVVCVCCAAAHHVVMQCAFVVGSEERKGDNFHITQF